MRDCWLDVVDSVLRPARPHLERCSREREHGASARRACAEARARAIAGCEARIERARAAVFAADDGVVSSRMTDLEREWRLLCRPDRDAGVMELWARIAPPAWLDRKRWRDSEPDRQIESAILLAADVDGVEAAESAVAALRAALVPFGQGRVAIGSRVRWSSSAHDFSGTNDLLAEPLRAARDAITRHESAAVVLDRAERLGREVHDAARERLRERPVLVGALAHAAFVDHVLEAARATSALDAPNPVAPLRDLWKTGYVLSAADASGVTLEIPDDRDLSRPPAR